MERKCRHEVLSRQPLVLAIGQIRFSPVRKMAEYIRGIQEDLRRKGYPTEKHGFIRQLSFRSQDVLQTAEMEVWEYRTRNEDWSIFVSQDSIAVQTTEYTKFEDFADRMREAVSTVLSKTESDRLGVVERVGLRYVDLVKPLPGESFRDYLRPGFHGLGEEPFALNSARLFVQCTGRTDVSGETEGTLLVRISQNDQGADLPPDLIATAPKRKVQHAPGELLTLIDMDHSVTGSFNADADWVVKIAVGLHDGIIETFHERVVTEKALEAWK